MNICTWIYEEEAADSRYAAPDRSSSGLAETETAWKCAVVFFATSRKFNPEARHVLFTNAKRIPAPGGFNLERYLTEKLKVVIERLPAFSSAPYGYDGMRKKPMYLFDVIRRLSRMEEEDRALYAVMVPACVWIRPSFIIRSQLERYGLATLNLGDVPGTAPSPIRRIYEDMLAAPLDRAPESYDLACFAGQLKEIRLVAEELDRVWDASLERFRRNRHRLRTEAELLGFVYDKLGYRAGTANPFIRTIRTGRGGNHRTEREDLYLTVWHAPDETDRGFARLYRDIVKNASFFWKSSPGAFRHYLSRRMGIPSRGGLARLRDLPEWVNAVRRRHRSGKKDETHG